MFFLQLFSSVDDIAQIFKKTNFFWHMRVPCRPVHPLMYHVVGRIGPCVSSITLLHCLETGYFPELEVQHLRVNSGDRCCLHNCACLYMSDGDLNSGPQDFRARTLTDSFEMERSLTLLRHF